MINAPSHWDVEAEYKDVESQNYWAEAVRLDEDGTDPGRKGKIKRGLQLMARDHARLPFQWDASTNAGFSSGTPWMRVHDEYPEINAKAQEGDEQSVLSFYKMMLTMRKHHKDLFVYGTFELLDPQGKETFVYRKRYGEKTAVVVLNFTTDDKPLPKEAIEGLTLLVSSYGKIDGEGLQPLEGRIYVNY
jgi:oligo-1,6-glucosidase